MSENRPPSNMPPDSKTTFKIFKTQKSHLQIQKTKISLKSPNVRKLTPPNMPTGSKSKVTQNQNDPKSKVTQIKTDPPKYGHSDYKKKHLVAKGYQPSAGARRRPP